MKVSNKAFVLICVGGLAVIGFAMFASHRGWFDRSVAERNRETQTEVTEASDDQPDLPPAPNWERVGGVWRPPTDTQATNKPNGKPERNRAPLPNPGLSKPIAKETSPQSQSIAQSLETGENMGRVSPFFANPKFDQAAFEKDPQGYLSEHNARRAFEPAEEAENVKPIKRLSPYYQKIIQGETVVLRAQGEPNMPVSFYAPRLGIFEESQTSAVSVQADEKGIAQVHYQATPGTHGDTPVVAASPVNSKQTRFVVHVLLPDQGVSN